MNDLERLVLSGVRRDGFVPRGIKSEDGMIFVVDADGPEVFLVTGFAFSAKGRHMGFVCADILIDMPTGRHYVMPFGTRFDLSELKPCAIAREIVERDLRRTLKARRMILDRQGHGKKVGRALQIADRRIKNLGEYLERDNFRRGTAFAAERERAVQSEREKSCSALARKGEKAMAGEKDVLGTAMLGLDIIDSAVDLAAEWAAEPENGAQNAELAIAMIGGAVSGVRHSLRALFDAGEEERTENDE
jgi:hypothetical protein